jgi:hypothetical protein
MNRITWVEHNPDYTKGVVGRFKWCEITRVNDSPFWVFKPQYKYVVRSLLASAGIVEKHTRNYGGYFDTIEEAKVEAEAILECFLEEANAI